MEKYQSNLSIVNDGCTYKLYAVLYHFGQMNLGHNYAICLRNNVWYKEGFNTTF